MKLELASAISTKRRCLNSKCVFTDHPTINVRVVCLRNSQPPIRTPLMAQINQNSDLNSAYPLLMSIRKSLNWLCLKLLRSPTNLTTPTECVRGTKRTTTALNPPPKSCLNSKIVITVTEIGTIQSLGIGLTLGSAPDSANRRVVTTNPGYQLILNDLWTLRIKMTVLINPKIGILNILKENYLVPMKLSPRLNMFFRKMREEMNRQSYLWTWCISRQIYLTLPKSYRRVIQEMISSIHRVQAIRSLLIASTLMSNTPLLRSHSWFSRPKPL